MSKELTIEAIQEIAAKDESRYPEFKVGHKIVTLVIRFKNSITPHRKGDEPVKVNAL